jgi:hypothetical protein
MMHVANAVDAEETSFMQSESRVFVSSLFVAMSMPASKVGITNGGG